MIVKDINIINYKNIAESNIECCPRFNCFIGNNGMGKTNILDAIYHLSMCKSYFSLPDSQSIRHGEPFFVLEGQYERDGEDVSVYCGLKRGQKKVFKKNKTNYDKLSEHIGLLPLVMISPADTSLIDGGSEERRKFMDGVISQCDKGYLQNLIRYNRVLTQRNKILKDTFGMPIDADMLSVLDEQLAEYGNEILNIRYQFIKEIIGYFQVFYEAISLGRDEVKMEYAGSVKNNDFLLSLKEAIEKDRILTYTTVGIHKDDLKLSLEDYPVKKIGSQGQKKSFLIALKMAQYAYLAERKGIKPLLLLDDIFDKLDTDRVNQIIKIVSGDDFGQIFITDTNRANIDIILQEYAPGFKIFNVDAGSVKEIH